MLSTMGLHNSVDYTISIVHGGSWVLFQVEPVVFIHFLNSTFALKLAVVSARVE